MAWIIGRKSDKTLIEVSNNEGVTLSSLETMFVLGFGGTKDDYSFFDMTGEEYGKYIDGQSYNIVWTGNDITSIDFSPEDSKPWIKLYTDKTSIEDNGIDTANITLEFWKPDLSSIFNVVNMTARRVPISTPNGIRFVRLNIVNGVAHAKFKCTEHGEYTFPSEPKRYGTSRIFNQIKIEVDATSLLELF